MPKWSPEITGCQSALDRRSGRQRQKSKLPQGGTEKS